MANSFSKIMRDFLQPVALDVSCEHLVSWKVCCCPKKEGGLSLSNLVPKNIILATKWLWRFPLDPHSL